LELRFDPVQRVYPTIHSHAEEDQVGGEDAGVGEQNRADGVHA